MSEEKGLVIIYTGEGKGKTTAAVGLAVRAAGYSKKILFVQFGKNSFSGELKSLEKLKIKIIQGGKGFVKILGDKLPLSVHKKKALETYDILYKEVISGKWDLVIADEIVGAASSGLILESLVIKLIQANPQNSDLILTGHHASKKLIGLSDLVTEMKLIKHPFEKGVLAKKGVDF